MKRFYFSLALVVVFCIIFAMAVSYSIQKEILSFLNLNFPNVKSFFDSFYILFVKSWWNLAPINELQPLVIILIGVTIFMLYYQIFFVIDELFGKNKEEEETTVVVTRVITQAESQQMIDPLRLSTQRALTVNEEPKRETVSTIEGNIEKYFASLNPLRFDQLAIEPGIVTMSQLEEIRLGDEIRHEEPSIDKLFELLELFGPTIPQSVITTEIASIPDAVIEEVVESATEERLIVDDLNSEVIKSTVDVEGTTISSGIILPDEDGFQEISVPISKIRVYSKEDFIDQKNIIDLLIPITEKTEYVTKKVKSRGLDKLLADFQFDYIGVWNPNFDEEEFEQQGIDSYIGAFRNNYYNSKLKYNWVVLPTNINLVDKYPTLAKEEPNYEQLDYLIPAVSDDSVNTLLVTNLESTLTEFFYNYNNVITFNGKEGQKSELDTGPLSIHVRQFFKNYFDEYDPNRDKETIIDYQVNKFIQSYLNKNEQFSTSEIVDVFFQQYLESKLENGYTVLESNIPVSQKYSPLPIDDYTPEPARHQIGPVKSSNLEKPVNEFLKNYLVKPEEPTNELTSIRRRRRMVDSEMFYENLDKVEKKAREEEFPFVQGIRPRKQYQSLEEMLSDDSNMKRARRHNYNFKDKK